MILIEGKEPDIKQEYGAPQFLLSIIGHIREAREEEGGNAFAVPIKHSQSVFPVHSCSN